MHHHLIMAGFNLKYLVHISLCLCLLDNQISFVDSSFPSTVSTLPFLLLSATAASSSSTGSFAASDIRIQANDDFVILRTKRNPRDQSVVVNIPVLMNDDLSFPSSSSDPSSGTLPIDTATCILHSTNTRSSSSSSSTPTIPTTVPLRFQDITQEAGVRGIAPQKIVKTSPNCIFDQFDTERKVWDEHSFCMPEILTGGASTGDINHDGYDDIYVTRLDTIDSLYRNNGDGTFTDITIESGLGLTQTIRSNAVAIFDIDNDGDNDIFISTLGDKRMYLFVNDGTGHFTEEAIERGADMSRPNVPSGEGGLTSSFSIAIGDYDMDGYLDIYTTEWFPRLDLPSFLSDPEQALAATTCRLLRNRGSDSGDHSLAGYFTDTTYAAGIRVKLGGYQPDAPRMNPDWWWSDEAQTQARNFLRERIPNEEEVENRLYRLNSEAQLMFGEDVNRGELLQAVHNTIFSDAHTLRKDVMPFHYMAFPYVGAFQFGARFTDLNNDGYPDLIVSGDFGTTQLYWNNRNGTFSPGPLHLLWDHFDNSMGASIGDINADGKQDVLFTSMALKAPTRVAVNRFFPNAGIASNFEGNHLYVNEGNGLFTDVTPHAGVKDTGWAWGGVLFDYDNDGWLDMAICNGMDDPETTDDDFAVNTPNAAFHNNGPRGNFTFTPVGTQLGLDDKRDGRGYFEFDYDYDGDLDLFLVNHADYPVLYRNNGGNTLNYLRVRVKEASCRSQTNPSPSSTMESYASSCTPRDSIGAKVYVQAVPQAREFVREIGSAAAFMAQSELVAHFGLGSNLQYVHRLRIYWPRTNTTRILYNVPVRIELRVRSPSEPNQIISTRYTDISGTYDAVEIKNDGNVNMVVDNTYTNVGVPYCKELTMDIDRISVPPNHGQVQITQDKQYLMYTPDPKFTGNDTFTYVIRKGTETSTATVHIQVVNKASSSPPSDTKGSTVNFPEQPRHPVLTPTTDTLPYINGRYNNLRNPEYGAVGTPLVRLGAPRYSEPDGTILPGTERDSSLPSPRLVSNKIMSVPPPKESLDATSAPIVGSVNGLFLSFSAFLMNDLVDYYPLGNLRKPSDGDAVKDNIPVPIGDSIWDPDHTGTQTMPFRRSLYHLVPSSLVLSESLVLLPLTNHTGTNVLRYRQQVNTVTHFMDLHNLYGNDLSRQSFLLNHKTILFGSLAMQHPNNDIMEDMSSDNLPTAIAAERKGRSKTLLPFNTNKQVTNANVYNKPHNTLFLTGDERVNLFPGLMVMHTLWAREHNRICALIGNDESVKIQIVELLEKAANDMGVVDRIFTAATTLARARYQAIIWNEWLPMVLGPEMYRTIPPYQGYNETLNPSVSNEFATVASIFWHSGWNAELLRLDPQYKPLRIGNVRLRDSFFMNGKRIISEGGIDPYIRGQWYQPIEPIDMYYNDDLRNHFISSNTLGLDLAAIDIQRGRDHGIPSYTTMRRILNLPPITSFQDFVPKVNLSSSRYQYFEKLVQRLEEVYQNNIDNVDLLVGGLMEMPLAGGLVGPTFGAIIKDQFLRLRDGDRFWYQNTNEKVFTTLLQTVQSLSTVNNAAFIDILKENTNVEISNSMLGSLTVGEKTDDRLVQGKPSVFITRKT